MSKEKRILLELFAPPLLAVMWMTVEEGFMKSESIFITLVALFPMLMFAYLFSIIPSLIYTLVMETWFRAGLGARLGLFSTAGLSSLLGAGACFLACAIGIWLGPLISFNRGQFALIGAGAGLLIGFYVGRKQASAF